MQEHAKLSYLPDYQNPPVVESILGVQFNRLPKLTSFHLGSFWETLNHDEWPTLLETPALLPQFEKFDEPDAKWDIGQIRLGEFLASGNRMQIKNQTSDGMIQIQNGRIHFNWLGKGNEYPRYDHLKNSFSSAFQRFVDFIGSQKLGELNPNQWEVTYLNHIPKGTVWTSPADWTFFRPLCSASTHTPVTLESFGGEWHYVIPEKRGRLHVALQHGEKDGLAIIVLTLTARGPLPEKANRECVLESLDFGRGIIVRSFEKLMTDEANTYWGLKNASS